MTVLEISLTAGNGSSKGSQRCIGRSVSWGGGREERKVVATQRRMEKKRKICGRRHGERTWEMSFIVTHTGVISDWRGTDGLEENLCLEGQGKALKDLAHRGVREAQTQLGGVVVSADSRTWSVEGTTGARDSWEGWGQLKRLIPLGTTALCQPGEMTASTAELIGTALDYPADK